MAAAAYQNRALRDRLQVAEGKGHSVMDRGKDMLLSDRFIKEVSSFKLGDHRTCGQGVGPDDMQYHQETGSPGTLRILCYLLKLSHSCMSPVCACVRVCVCVLYMVYICGVYGVYVWCVWCIWCVCVVCVLYMVCMCVVFVLYTVCMCDVCVCVCRLLAPRRHSRRSKLEPYR